MKFHKRFILRIRAGERIREIHEASHLWTFVAPETAPALRVLGNLGYRLAVISNADGRVEALIRDAGLMGFFEFVMDSEVEGVEKPDPEIFHLALKKCGCRAGEAVFIDDFIDNVYSAQQIGMHAIHFTNPQQAVDALNRLLSNHP